LNSLAKPVLEDQIKRYEEIFKKIIENEVTLTEMDETITQF
jgi:hypothetical protein